MAINAKQLIVIGLIFSIFSVSPAFAQQKIVPLAQVGSYQTTASVTITSSQGKYNIEITSSNLPASIPNGGSYYIVWATIPDGRADNLGTITNGTALKTTLSEAPKQIFITAEKERFPEFVQGPRISQSAEIPATDLPALTATPRPSVSPSGQGVGGGGGTTVGTPNDVSETGLGGGLIFYGLTTALAGIGSLGLASTYFKKNRNRNNK